VPCTCHRPLTHGYQLHAFMLTGTCTPGVSRACMAQQPGPGPLVTAAEPCWEAVCVVALKGSRVYGAVDVVSDTGAVVGHVGWKEAGRPRRPCVDVGHMAEGDRWRSTRRPWGALHHGERFRVGVCGLFSSDKRCSELTFWASRVSDHRPHPWQLVGTVQLPRHAWFGAASLLVPTHGHLGEVSCLSLQAPWVRAPGLGQLAASAESSHGRRAAGPPPQSRSSPWARVVCTTFPCCPSAGCDRGCTPPLEPWLAVTRVEVWETVSCLGAVSLHKSHCDMVVEFSSPEMAAAAVQSVAVGTHRFRLE
jgi:hypothetical protein